MKHKFTVICFILLFAVLFSSCDNVNVPDPVESDSEQENIQKEIESEADSFKKIRESKELWIIYGLEAYENEKSVENLKEFFSDRSNMTYLTLYNHMFQYDKEKSVLVAEALFNFICNEYGIDAVSDIDKRCEYKTAYLRSLGLDTDYVQSKEIESFFISMNFSSNATYKYIMSFDNVTYYFKDFNSGSPTQYHGFLYYSTTGLFEMINYLKENNLCYGLDTDREFNYYMVFDGSAYNKTIYSNGNMYINDGYSTLHEAVHAMGITKKDNIWLSEGICNYFGKNLGFHDQIAASNIQILTMAERGYFDDGASTGDESSIRCKEIYERYTSLGGKFDSLDTFDYRLYTDILVKRELETQQYTTIGHVYKLINNIECDTVGEEISYEQATSLVMYLIDIYGIENVLNAYHTQNIVETFGKNYEDLKDDWLIYLNQFNN